MPTPYLPRIATIPVLPALPPHLAFTQGDIWHVKPSSGLDTNSGKSPVQAFKTLAKALAKATADQNDIVLLYSESNSGALTSDLQATMLNWNKDGVHLIGVNSGVSMSPRSRIAPVATWTSANPVMTVSANNCYFANLQIIMDAVDATPLGALAVTGSRLRFDNCHILGIVYTTNDIPGAYSLLCSGAEEVEFHGCTFGSDRTVKGAQANSVVKFANVAKNILFSRSRFRMVTTSQTAHVFVRAASGSLDGSVAFVNGCAGINSQSRNVGGLELSYAMIVAADAGGDVWVSPCSSFQAAELNSTNSGNVYAATATSGFSVPAAH